MACVEEKRIVCRGLVWKPEGKEHMENTSLGGNVNIKLHRKETGWHVMDWLCLAWDRGT